MLASNDHYRVNFCVARELKRMQLGIEYVHEPLWKHERLVSEHNVDGGEMMSSMHTIVDA
jgi:hypothetical protein